MDHIERDIDYIMHISAKVLLFTVLMFVSAGYLYTAFAKTRPHQAEIIEQIMDYQMPEVIKRCKKDFNYTDDDMRIIEREFKRFIVMSVILKDTGIGMYSKDVDNLWHSFILFTKEYTDFCTTFNGKFIHHVPEVEEKTPEKRAEVQKDFQQFIKNYEELFHEEIHPVWFLDMFEDNEVT